MAIQPEESGAPVSFWHSWYGVVFAVLGAVTLYFLLTKHLSHFLAIVPFLFLLSCPLMHFFMHGRHGKHGRHTQDTAPMTPDDAQDRR